ncbi:MAG: hypothetical protein ACYDCL_21305 [Myxococcales bacterium]
MAASTLGRFGNAGFLRGSLASSVILGVLAKLRPGAGLSASGARALTAAVEALVPRLPGSAPAADLHAVVLRAQANVYALARRDRRDLCAYLDLLEHAVPVLARAGLTFSRLTAEQRLRCLAACERSSIALLATGYAALRHLALVAYMEAPEAWPDPAALAP